MALIGYARVSKSDGSQELDTQVQKLREAGVDEQHMYIEQASGAKDDRPVFASAFGHAARVIASCTIAQTG